MPRMTLRARFYAVVLGCLLALAGSLSAQMTGALTGRIIYTSAGHGWVYDNSADKWFTQRGDNYEVVEDYGNLDQLNLFAEYCLRAGATVVPMRPVGFQTNEVVLDNDSPGIRFSGSWSDSSGAIYYGNAGDVPYRFATIASSETATATYTPTLPATGFYPVYAWAAAGDNRTSQLYKILHTGGQTLVRVPHDLVGGGWVYLGTYYFLAGSNAASGAVIISNLQPTPAYGSVVIADAIRFGNGMGDVAPVSTGGGTPTVSGYPREEEGARYWVQRSVGQGQPASLYDTPDAEDGSDNVGAPIRMAAQMNREANGRASQRVYLGFHSNAANGSARGCVGLYNNNTLFPGTATPNQFRLAQLVATELDADLAAAGSPPLETNWYSRAPGSLTYARSDYAFGEINNLTIQDEFDATIIEVAFHDNENDAKLLRDPKARTLMARAAYQGLVRYFNEFDGAPLVFAPEPPANVRARASGGNIVVSWQAGGSGGGTPAGYLVYRSTNGYGFGQPVATSASPFVFTNLAANTAWYFRVTATNAGGESLFSACVGCRVAGSGDPPVLVVQAYDRYDRSLAVRQTAGPGIGGIYGGSQTFDRVKPREMNSFDYVVPHGQALQACGVGFDSCRNGAVSAGLVNLANYPAVIWALGQESVNDETFSAAEQALLAAYLNGGGQLFVSGSEIAYDLDRASGPTAGDRAFLHNYLHASLGGDANTNAGTYQAAPAAGALFAGNATVSFDDGTRGVYRVWSPNRLVATGAGALVALVYQGGLGGPAAVQYDGSLGGGKVVYLAFPFETIAEESARVEYLADVLRFFNVLPRPRLAQANLNLVNGTATFTWTAIAGRAYRLQWCDNLSAGVWNTVGGDIVATNTTVSRADPTLGAAPRRFYRVLLVD